MNGIEIEIVKEIGQKQGRENYFSELVIYNFILRQCHEV